ncbi:hypothetical protein SUGI_0462690 [Cryptomeria japonica]|nr:hypothetical protein SUGI_0462690 [Cryptomeria japonica]
MAIHRGAVKEERRLIGATISSPSSSASSASLASSSPPETLTPELLRSSLLDFRDQLSLGKLSLPGSWEIGFDFKFKHHVIQCPEDVLFDINCNVGITSYNFIWVQSSYFPRLCYKEGKHDDQGLR